MFSTHLLLVGGGHAHVEVLRRLARRPQPGLRITLISRERRMLYSGMLPGVIRGEYGLDDASIDLDPMARAAKAELIVGEAVALDLTLRRALVASFGQIGFDLLSLDIGGMQPVPEGAGLAVKPIDGFLAGWIAIESRLAQGMRVTVVGGGAAGTELVLALARRFRGQVRLTLVSAGPEPLDLAPARARRIVRAGLLDAGVALVSGVSAAAAENGRLLLSDGSFLETEVVLWATGIHGPGFLAASGLACDEAGCIRVDACLRSLSHEFVFAAGDCAAFEHAPRPKAGVWAVRAGAPLTENLRRAATNRPLHQWHPQREALAILGLGDGRAVAWRNGIALSGRPVWAWKDWIDRRWVSRHRIVPQG
jgi:selenide,water dikinase